MPRLKLRSDVRAWGASHPYCRSKKYDSHVSWVMAPASKHHSLSASLT